MFVHFEDPIADSDQARVTQMMNQTRGFLKKAIAITDAAMANLYLFRRGLDVLLTSSEYTKELKSYFCTAFHNHNIMETDEEDLGKAE